MRPAPLQIADPFPSARRSTRQQYEAGDAEYESDSSSDYARSTTPQTSPDFTSPTLGKQVRSSTLSPAISQHQQVTVNSLLNLHYLVPDLQVSDKNVDQHRGHGD